MLSARLGLRRGLASAAAGRGLAPFHLAIPVNDLPRAREFYGEVLGCGEGRGTAVWQDFNFFGHQLVAHLVPGYDAAKFTNSVDGDDVPVPHFGLVLDVETFHETCGRLREAGVPFGIEPRVRHQGAPGEQWTCFFRDPSGNAVELKALTGGLDTLFSK